MKKFLFVLAIAAFAACNDTSTSSESTTDSATAPATTDTATMTAPVDTAATVAPADTTKAR